MSWKQRLNEFCQKHKVPFTDNNFELVQEYEPNGPWICRIQFPEVNTQAGKIDAAEYQGNGTSKKTAMGDVCRRIVLLISKLGHLNAEKVKHVVGASATRQNSGKKEKSSFKLGTLKVPVGLLQTRQRLSRGYSETGEKLIQTPGEIVEARDYQTKLFERAKLENIIIWLGTGTGKTFISCMLLQYYWYVRDMHKSSEAEASCSSQITQYLGNKEQHKVSVFVVPRVSLVGQQASAIRDNTNLRVGEYWGELGVNEWKLGRWEKEFRRKDCLVMTYQILLNLLQQNFLRLTDINVLVVDECHNVHGGNPMAVVFKIYYSKLPKQTRPRVLGLTATPYTKNLPQVMDSKIVTASQDLYQQLPNYTPKAREIQVMYRAYDLQNERNKYSGMGDLLLGTCVARLKVCHYLCHLESCAIHERKQSRINQQLNEADEEDLEQLQGDTVQMRQKTKNQLLEQASRYLGVRSVLKEMGPLACLYALKIAIGQERSESIDVMEMDEEAQQVMMIDATVDLTQLGCLQMDRESLAHDLLINNEEARDCPYILHRSFDEYGMDILNAHSVNITQQQRIALFFAAHAVLMACLHQQDWPEEYLDEICSHNYWKNPFNHCTGIILQILSSLEQKLSIQHFFQQPYESRDGFDTAEMHQQKLQKMQAMDVNWLTIPKPSASTSQQQENQANQQKKCQNNIFVKFRKIQDFDRQYVYHHPFSKLLTHKAFKLIQGLICGEDGVSQDWRGIVFVQDRLPCQALADLLYSVPQLKQSYRVAFITGHGGSSIGMAASEQKIVLQRFHEGKFNILVGTRVIEEGLDVPQCKLVVRFNLPESFTSFKQSAGRARAKKSQFWLMMEDGSESADDYMYDIGIKKAAELLYLRNFWLEELRNHYQFECDVGDEGQEAEQENIACEHEWIDGELPITNTETGASIYENQAVGIVSDYIHRMRNDEYCQDVIQYCFSYTKLALEAGAEVFRYIIRFPSNSKAAGTILGPWRNSRYGAKRACALKACRHLVDRGQLNSSLHPRARIRMLDDDRLRFSYGGKFRRTYKDDDEHFTKAQQMGDFIYWVPLLRPKRITPQFCEEKRMEIMPKNEEFVLYLHGVQGHVKGQGQGVHAGVMWGLLTLQQIPEFHLKMPLQHCIKDGQVSEISLANLGQVKLNKNQLMGAFFFHMSVMDVEHSTGATYLHLKTWGEWLKKQFPNKLVDLQILLSGGHWGQQDANRGIKFNNSWYLFVPLSKFGCQQTIQSVGALENQQVQTKQQLKMEYHRTVVLQCKEQNETLMDQDFSSQQTLQQEEELLNNLNIEKISVSDEQQEIVVQQQLKNIRDGLLSEENVVDVGKKQWEGDVWMIDFEDGVDCLDISYLEVSRSCVLNDPVENVKRKQVVDEQLLWQCPNRTMKILTNLRLDLSPARTPPDQTYYTFDAFYRKKYKVMLSNLDQPLLKCWTWDPKIKSGTLVVDSFKPFTNDNTDPQTVEKIPEEYKNFPYFKDDGYPKSDRPWQQQKKGYIAKSYYLAPEMCLLSPLNAHFFRNAQNLSDFTWQLEWILRMADLRSKLCVAPPPMRPCPVNPPLDLLLEAMTHPRAGEGINYERLEILGDAFLKYATVEYLFLKYIQTQEGKLTPLSHKYQQNKHLIHAAMDFGLYRYVRFTTREELAQLTWKPSGTILLENFIDVCQDCGPADFWKVNVKQKNDQKQERSTKKLDDVTSLSELVEVEEGEQYQLLNITNRLHCKGLGDVVEAVAGAFFVSGGEDAAQWCLERLAIIPHPPGNDPMILKQYTPPHARDFQTDYDFDSADEAEEQEFGAGVAVPMQPPKYSNYDQIVMDKHLTLAQHCIKYTFKHKGLLLAALTHASRSRILKHPSYERLEFLGDGVIGWLLVRHWFLMDESMDPGRISDLRDASVNNERLAVCCVQHNLYKYMFHDSIKLRNDIILYVNEVRELTIDIARLQAEQTFGIGEVGASKVLGDLVEAVVGAVYMDCGRDLVKSWEVVQHLLGDLPNPKNIPVHPIRQLIVYCVENSYQLKIFCRRVAPKIQTEFESGRRVPQQVAASDQLLAQKPSTRIWKQLVETKIEVIGCVEIDGWVIVESITAVSVKIAKRSVAEKLNKIIKRLLDLEQPNIKILDEGMLKSDEELIEQDSDVGHSEDEQDQIDTHHY